jgi:predicted N-acyltransferase
VQGPEQLQSFLDGLEQELRNKHWRYIEIRPLQPTKITSSLCRPAAEYSFHQLGLQAELDTIFHGFHKSSTQRKILRAQREGIKYEEGSSDSLLDSFYPLLVATRRRHRVPPQPKSWFLNLMNCFGEALKIRLALKDGRPVAGMLTIRHKDTLVYKYGGSAIQFNKLGGMHLLYWESLRDAKNSGLQVFDFGRSDAHEAGLIRFKNRWGATQSSLTYLRLAESVKCKHFFDPANSNLKTRVLKYGFAHLPASVLSVLGKLLYKHVG